MNKHKIIFLLSLLISISCKSQDFEKVILNSSDTSDLYINDGESNELYYLKLIPKGKIKGAIVLLPSGGETTQDLLKQISIPKLAFDKGIATIIPSINWGTEDRKVEIKTLNRIFREVVEKHNISKEKFVIGGLSNGGMISLVYAQLSVKERNETYVKPIGVFGLDVPLDKAHFYEYCEREIKRNFSELGVGEAKWIMNNYNEIYGGSPEEFSEKYIEASIYSNGAENGGNAKYLKNIPIRMYTDLDVNWLMNERRRDLYDWNGTDIVAMINDLKLMGNKHANVIKTMGKAIKLDGTKHPHSWTIMDNKDCFNWIEKLMKNN
jgi:6-phosphogluconolactonase/glucosamine-6-phosphate isomerase/deaminase